MLCNICGANESTIHLTEIINSQMVEIHLCEECAREKGTDFKTHFNFGDLLAGLSEFGGPFHPTDKRTASKCSSCGMTYEQFGKNGRLGCAVCYDSFAKMLVPLIKRIQRSIRHIGKKPSKVAGQVRPPQNLRVLQDRLRKCVQQEEFEEAAGLRDQIKQVEDKTKRPKRGEK